MAELKAQGSKVIVELEDGDFSTHDLGLLLPTNDKKRQIMKQFDKRKIDKSYTLHMRDALVVSVGDKCKYLEPGQRTRVNIHNGVSFKYDDKKFLSLEEVDTELVVLI